MHIHHLDSEEIDRDGIAQLAGMDGVLVPGGFGKRGVEGKIKAIRHAREHGIPYLGICLGMQLAVIEFARDVVGLKDATAPSSSRNSASGDALTDGRNRDGKIERRTAQSDLGGTVSRRTACDSFRARWCSGSTRRDDQRAASSSLRSQQSLHSAPRGRGPEDQRDQS